MTNNAQELLDICRRWMEREAEKLELSSQSRGEDSEKGRYEKERARAFRAVLEAMQDISRGNNMYRYR